MRRRRCCAVDGDGDVAGFELHDSSSVRARKISQRKKGAPMSAVTTPSFSSMPTGRMRTRMSAASSRRSAAERAGEEQAAGRVADQRAQQVGHDEADEADAAGDGCGGADADRRAADDQCAGAVEIHAEAGGGFLAEAERVERAGAEARASASRAIMSGPASSDVIHARSVTEPISQNMISAAA